MQINEMLRKYDLIFQDTNPLEGSAPLEAVVGASAGSSDELSSKPGDSPTRKRRRISRHLSTGEQKIFIQDIKDVTFDIENKVLHEHVIIIGSFSSALI